MSKLIIIGIDGFDPLIAEKLMSAGQLLNFSYFKENGSYRRLATVTPAQSPVVWSSIAVGGNPGQHGLFDFIFRNPSDYLPRLSILKPNTRNILGRRSAMFLPVRGGIPFWSITSRHNIKTTVIKWPITFPPEKVSGKMLSGLGVPDLRNTLGRYVFYSTADLKKEKGDVIKLSVKNGKADSFIPGPNKSKLAVKIKVNFEKRTLDLEIESKNYTLKEKEWSDWINLIFKINIGQRISGISKFYLDSLKPEIKIYVSAININPKKPAFPISYPDSYAAELASEIGSYHTLGLPEETNGLVDDCFSETAFLGFVNNLQNEREKIFWRELSIFKEGVFSFVFDILDRLQHIFWIGFDPKHPLYNQEQSKRYQRIIFDYYYRMDKIIGKVSKSLDKDDLLIIVSDHGFKSFRRALNLNSWLIQQGLMGLKNSSAIGKSLFENVDWKRTKAYAVGFSSIYLNLKGRDRDGIVSPGEEADKLSQKIIRALVQLKDPKNQELVINNAYLSREIYTGPYLSRAPDIIVGTNPGYRISWQTAVGAAPASLIEDNIKKWSGDHLIDSSYVPGVLFINREITKKQPHCIDIAPTILKYFQIPNNMEGESLL